MLEVFNNKVVICANNERLFIGKVSYLSKDMHTCILKDARLILPPTGTAITLESLVASTTNVNSFAEFCSSMTVPLPSIGVADVAYILEVDEYIKNIYTAATKNDISTLKEQNKENSPSWAMKNKTTSWNSHTPFLG